MNLVDRLHMLHRCWRFRLRTERESVRFLLKQNLQGLTALDIGANRGVYSYWLSKQVGPTGRVIAFEPQPELIEHLADLKRSFRLHQLEIEGIGLSAVRGTSQLVRRKVGDGGATLTQRHLTDHEGLSTVPVEIDTLDHRLAAHGAPRIAFIKCDVEGHELSVFQGSVCTLARDRPMLLFECHHRQCQEGEVFSFLASLGYDGFFFEGTRRIRYTRFAEHPYSPGATHRNYVFVHTPAAARAARVSRAA